MPKKQIKEKIIKEVEFPLNKDGSINWQIRKSPMPQKELKEKIIEILEEDLVNSTCDFNQAINKQTNQILELFDQEKQKWAEKNK